MIVVSDTSPLTNLLQIGRAELLHCLYGEVLMPGAVQRELLSFHPTLPDFLRCVPVTNQAAVSTLLKELDPGEAEAIVLARETAADVLLIDEEEGRAVAAREGIRYIGLLGVLVQAKLASHVPSLRELVAELEQNTAFYLSKDLKAMVFERAGEA